MPPFKFSMTYDIPLIISRIILNFRLASWFCCLYSMEPSHWQLYWVTPQSSSLWSPVDVCRWKHYSLTFILIDKVEVRFRFSSCSNFKLFKQNLTSYFLLKFHVSRPLPPNNKMFLSFWQSYGTPKMMGHYGETTENGKK